MWVYVYKNIKGIKKTDKVTWLLYIYFFLPIENKMGEVLVQASKYNLVLLYTEEWQRCKSTFAVV